MTLARILSITPMSFLVALAAALVGFLEVIFIDRLIYPFMRRRHERQKVTGTHGMNPSTVMQLVKLQGLVLLPALGFLFGEHFFGAQLRAMME